MIKGMVVREVTPLECKWLQWKVNPGRIVYKYNGCQYGTVGLNGVAVTNEPDELPFYELPFDSVRWIEN
jgi:hypothetical protein